MDPDKTLDSLRELVEITHAGDPGGTARVARFAELVDALDGWLTKGGHLPGPWAVRRPAVTTTAPLFASDQNRIGQ
jgi:hypothetical protein